MCREVEEKERKIKKIPLRNVVFPALLKTNNDDHFVMNSFNEPVESSIIRFWVL